MLRRDGEHENRRVRAPLARLRLNVPWGEERSAGGLTAFGRPFQMSTLSAEGLMRKLYRADEWQKVLAIFQQLPVPTQSFGGKRQGCREPPYDLIGGLSWPIGPIRGSG